MQKYRKLKPEEKMKKGDLAYWNMESNPMKINGLAGERFSVYSDQFKEVRRQIKKVGKTIRQGTARTTKARAQFKKVWMRSVLNCAHC